MKNKSFNWLYNTGAFLVLASAIFKIQHWPYSSILFIVGFFTGIFGFEMEIRRLKKKIKELEADQK
ncbi:MAG TPA: gliding motility protein GldL [Prolixibacteraceae bacterium]|nr:gliding motility protein GldL [Prolixibacteraceae bacterium]